MQPGTGLGLAIVNSIVRSDSINGKVDISSTEGVGTEIRVTFDATTIPGEDTPVSNSDKMNLMNRTPTISLVGFDDGSKGTALLREVVIKYLTQWWGFDVIEDPSIPSDIVLLNEDLAPLLEAVTEGDTRRPFVILTSARLDMKTGAVYDFGRTGGFCRVVNKPAGPSRLRQVLRACIQWIAFREGDLQASPSTPAPDGQRSVTIPQRLVFAQDTSLPGLVRHTSQDGNLPTPNSRPRMIPRAKTYHPILRTRTPPPMTSSTTPLELPSSPGDSTVLVGNAGTLLKSSLGSFEGRRGRLRVLLIEDNQILRDLLYVSFWRLGVSGNTNGT